MITVEGNITALQIDENGLLVQPELWDKEVAIFLARRLNIHPLTADHWKIIEALRKHYHRFGTAPTMHNICHANHQSRDWVHKLFHNCFNAWRVAGLPDPGEEAKAYLNDM